MIGWVDTALLLALIGLPLLGAFFTALVPGTDRVTLRYVGMGASLATAAVALRGLWLVVDRGAQTLELALPAISFPIQLALAEASLPGVLGVCAVVPMAIRAGAPSVQRTVKSYVLLILLSQSLALAALLVDQSLASLILADGLVVPVLLLLGLFGGERKGTLGLRFGVLWVAADGLALAALAAAASAPGGYSPPAELLGATLLLAGAVRLGCFPFTSWWISLYEEAPVFVVALLGAVIGPVGAELVRRGMQLTGGLLDPRSFSVVVGAAALTVFVASVHLLTARDLKRWVGAASGLLCGVALAALATGSAAAVAGALWLVPLSGLSVSTLAFIVDATERRTLTRDSAELTGLAQQLPGLWRLWMVAGVAALGLPVVGVGGVWVITVVELARASSFAAVGWLPHAGFFVALGLGLGQVWFAVSLVTHLRRALVPPRKRGLTPAPLGPAQAFRLWLPVVVVLLGGLLAHGQWPLTAASLEEKLGERPGAALQVAP